MTPQSIAGLHIPRQQLGELIEALDQLRGPLERKVINVERVRGEHTKRPVVRHIQSRRAA
jgi:hypothetical protein